MKIARRRILPLAAAAFLASALPATAARADVTIGLILSLTGPAASIGVPYQKGVAAAMERIPELPARNSSSSRSTTRPILRRRRATPAS